MSDNKQMITFKHLGDYSPRIPVEDISAVKPSFYTTPPTDKKGKAHYVFVIDIHINCGSMLIVNCDSKKQMLELVKKLTKLMGFEHDLIEI